MQFTGQMEILLQVEYFCYSKQLFQQERKQFALDVNQQLLAYGCFWLNQFLSGFFCSSSQHEVEEAGI